MKVKDDISVMFSGAVVGKTVAMFKFATVDDVAKNYRHTEIDSWVIAGNSLKLFGISKNIKVDQSVRSVQVCQNAKLLKGLLKDGVISQSDSRWYEFRFGGLDDDSIFVLFSYQEEKALPVERSGKELPVTLKKIFESDDSQRSFEASCPSTTEKFVKLVVLPAIEMLSDDCPTKGDGASVAITSRWMKKIYADDWADFVDNVDKILLLPEVMRMLKMVRHKIFFYQADHGCKRRDVSAMIKYLYAKMITKQDLVKYNLKGSDDEKVSEVMLKKDLFFKQHLVAFQIHVALNIGNRNDGSVYFFAKKKMANLFGSSNVKKLMIFNKHSVDKNCCHFAGYTDMLDGRGREGSDKTLKEILFVQSYSNVENLIRRTNETSLFSYKLFAGYYYTSDSVDYGNKQAVSKEKECSMQENGQEEYMGEKKDVLHSLNRQRIMTTYKYSDYKQYLDRLKTSHDVRFEVVLHSGVFQNPRRLVDKYLVSPIHFNEKQQRGLVYGVADVESCAILRSIVESESLVEMRGVAWTDLVERRYANRFRIITDGLDNVSTFIELNSTDQFGPDELQSRDYLSRYLKCLFHLLSTRKDLTRAYDVEIGLEFYVKGNTKSCPDYRRVRLLSSDDLPYVLQGHESDKDAITLAQYCLSKDPFERHYPNSEAAELQKLTVREEKFLYANLNIKYIFQDVMWFYQYHEGAILSLKSLVETCMLDIEFSDRSWPEKFEKVMGVVDKQLDIFMIIMARYCARFQGLGMERAQVQRASDNFQYEMVHALACAENSAVRLQSARASRVSAAVVANIFLREPQLQYCALASRFVGVPQKGCPEWFMDLYVDRLTKYIKQNCQVMPSILCQKQKSRNGEWKMLAP